MTENHDDLLLKINTLKSEKQELQIRLQEAEEALRAISTGEVDALVVYGDEGERIYTLQGADYAYRVMVESIHEGAATIKEDGTILYCNKRLAEMLERPLETVLGTSFFHYIHPPAHETFRELARKGGESHARAEFNLLRAISLPIPVLITASATDVEGRRGICLVVTDLTEQKQAIAREKELQIRLMDQREEERVRIARNLHDGPLQDLIALSFTLQAMGTNGQGQAIGSDLFAVREGILKLAGELRTVCNELRPPSTIRFGLAKAIQYQSEEYHSKYPQLIIHLDLGKDKQNIPKEISAVLFRIYQECMNNVIRHAHATEIKVKLRVERQSVLLEVQDNGQGFNPPSDWVELAREGHLGLVGMRERAEAVGGSIEVVSGSPKCKGTTIQVEVPCELCDP